MKTKIFLFDPKKSTGSAAAAFAEFLKTEKVETEKISLTMVFGSVEILNEKVVAEIYEQTGGAKMIGCSTGGEIFNEPRDGTILIILFEGFEKVETVGAEIPEKKCFQTAEKLGKDLKKFGEFQIGFVFSDGATAESEDILRGLQKSLGKKSKLFGGFAGDDGKFGATQQIVDGKIFEKGIVVALVKTKCEISTAWEHGFAPLGMGREITEIADGKITKIENKSTLDFYRDYLDEEQVLQMPLLGHHYPLGIKKKNGENILIRAVFDADHDDGSCIIRGTKCEVGDTAYVLLGQKKKVLKSAVKAAAAAKSGVKKPQIAFLVNCFGRKMVYKNDFKNEIAEIKNELGAIPLVGLYSYGEISPVSNESEYHNLTTNVLIFGE